MLLVSDKPSIVVTILKDRAQPLKHEESSGLCAPLPAGRPRQPGCCMYCRGLAGGCESLATRPTTRHGQSPWPAGDRAGSPRGPALCLSAWACSTCSRRAASAAALCLNQGEEGSRAARFREVRTRPRPSVPESCRSPRGRCHTGDAHERLLGKEPQTYQ